MTEQKIVRHMVSEFFFGGKQSVSYSHPPPPLHKIPHIFTPRDVQNKIKNTINEKLNMGLQKGKANHKKTAKEYTSSAE